MGYYTYHTLSVDGKQEGEEYEKHKDGIQEISEYGSILFEESVKWYDCDTDMRNYSSRHPNVVFRIDGEGEGSGDVWVSWYKNGKTQEWRALVSKPDHPPEAW